MRCAQVGLLVERYVDGALDPGQASEVSAHAMTCAGCRARIDAARSLAGFLSARPVVQAPRGFATRVMDAVYREALVDGRLRVERNVSGPAAAAPSRMYQRLGLSFLLTAGVLAATLLIPRLAYPALAERGESGLSRGSVVVVRSALDGAESAVRGILREQVNGGNAR
jgi:anti-sigma factor RsiW